MKNEKQLLTNAQKKTKALRQMRFESISEIDKHAVLEYVKEAIENHKLGKELKPNKKKGKRVNIPKELKEILKKDITLNRAFATLTPYKQREYVEYIDSAKRAQTKLIRLEKIIPMIQKGIGLNDMYKRC